MPTSVVDRIIAELEQEVFDRKHGGNDENYSLLEGDLAAFRVLHEEIDNQQEAIVNFMDAVAAYIKSPQPNPSNLPVKHSLMALAISLLAVSNLRNISDTSKITATVRAVI